MAILHSIPEAARLLGGVSDWTLRKHVSRRNVQVTRIGRRVFLPSEEIERIRREGLPSLDSRPQTPPNGASQAVAQLEKKQ